MLRTPAIRPTNHLHFSKILANVALSACSSTRIQALQFSLLFSSTSISFSEMRTLFLGGLAKSLFSFFRNINRKLLSRPRLAYRILIFSWLHVLLRRKRRNFLNCRYEKGNCQWDMSFNHGAILPWALRSFISSVKRLSLNPGMWTSPISNDLNDCSLKERAFRTCSWTKWKLVHIKGLSHNLPIWEETPQETHTKSQDPPKSTLDGRTT